MPSKILVCLLLVSSMCFAVVSKFTVTHDDSATQISSQIYAETKDEIINQVINYFKALKTGSRAGTLDVQIGEGDAVAGTGTLTFTGVPTAAETAVIGSVTLTAVANASTSTSTQFQIGTTAANAATNFASTFNANSTLAAVFTAAVSGSSAVVITCDYKGVTCNEIATTDTLTNAAWGAATISGGSEATANSYDFGR